MAQPLIRLAGETDLLAIIEIERQSFAQSHWTEAAFRQYNSHVAEWQGRVAGFLVWRQTWQGDSTSPPEREILNLAVSPSCRRSGIASALLASLLSQPATYFLEVRESNLSAQALYARFGFTELARRARYYEQPSETAIVMQMKKC